MLVGIVSVKPLNKIDGIDHVFASESLLHQALTHRSFGAPHYERLEFLGDSLLNLVAADLLFQTHPHAPEGDLSRLRSRLVRDATLAEIAKDLNLSQSLKLGIGEKKSGGFLRESILADVVEALIGAVYLDGGFDRAYQVVSDLLATRLADLPPADTLKDPKTKLQEHLQGKGAPLPDYRVLEEHGADHAKEFVVACCIEGAWPTTEARAPSRRKAEQMAARLMLDQIQASDKTQ